MKNRPYIFLLLLALLLAACTTDEDGAQSGLPTPLGADDVALQLSADELPWQEQQRQAGVTRSAMLDVMKDGDYKGFGLYCPQISSLNGRQVKWNATSSSWQLCDGDGAVTVDVAVWPRRYTISFNGVDAPSVAGFFSFEGNHNFNAKFAGCTYAGIDFTKGLKIEQSTQIKWNAPNKSVVTIVQSDWYDASSSETATVPVKLNDTQLQLADAQAIPGGYVFTLKDKLAGEYSIRRGTSSLTQTETVKPNSESGVFYVAVEPEVDAYAYAPYGKGTLSDSNLSFECLNDNSTDLLWARHESIERSKRVASLTFSHALAKLSMGTLTNNSGESITLKSVTITGDLYERGTLSLSDGTWTANSTDTEAREYTHSYGSVVIADKAESLDHADVTLLQIPGPTVNVTLTFTLAGSEQEHSATVSEHLVQGQHTVLNVEVKNNFKVVIKSDTP